MCSISSSDRSTDVCRYWLYDFELFIFGFQGDDIGAIDGEDIGDTGNIGDIGNTGDETGELLVYTDINWVMYPGEFPFEVPIWSRSGDDAGDGYP